MHDNSIHRVFHRAHGVYAQHFNAKYKFSGHLWQDRPFSCVLDAAHALNAVRYVERNPVRAGMVNRAEDYLWSSAAAHCGLREDALLALPPRDWPSVEAWSSWLEPAESQETAERLRRCTAVGKPCGDEAFLRTVAIVTGRDFSRKQPGRKPKDAILQEVPSTWADEAEVLR